jgi:hypothetical protein
MDIPFKERLLREASAAVKVSRQRKPSAHSIRFYLVVATLIFAKRMATPLYIQARKQVDQASMER